MPRLAQLDVPGVVELIISYTYDDVGSLISMTDATGTTTYTPDELNRLSQITYPGNQTIGYGYDDAGNLEDISTSFGVVHYEYDDNNRLDYITLPISEEVSYTYDATGNVTRVDYPNGTYAKLGDVVHNYHLTNG